MARIPRSVSPNTYHFLTAVTHHRAPFFAQPELAQIVIDQWRHYATVASFSLVAYTVMPDHYHVVLQTGNGATLSQILHAVHSYTVHQIAQQCHWEQKVRVWQSRTWDEVIQNEEMLWQKIAYTLANPWRAGLVSQPLAIYPFSNLAEWIETEGETFVLDLFAHNKRWLE